MEEKIIACDNKQCIKRDECERARLYDNGEKEYKTFSGTQEKGCGKYIKKDEGK